MKFKIRYQNEKFKICTDAPTYLEFKFVISDILLHVFLLSTYAYDEYSAEPQGFSHIFTFSSHI